MAKRAGFPIKKLLLSAVANAKEAGKDINDLFIKELMVDKGVTLKRMMPAAMGTGHRINKRTSHIALILGEKVASVPARNATHNVAGGKKVKKAKEVKEEKIEKKSAVKKVKATT